LKKFLLVLLLLGIAAAVTAFVLRRTPAAGDAAADATPKAKTIKVEKGNIDLRVSTTGKVTSNLDVEIKSKASGQIIQLPYDISDVVTSGSLLAELDPVDENRNVAQQQAALLSARAKLAQARESLSMAQTDVDTGTSNAIAQLESARVKVQETQARYQRGKDLLAKHLVSNEEMDVARSDTSAAERLLREAEVHVAELRNLPRTVELRKQDIQLNLAEVQRAEINMQNALQRLKETKIFAPMDGVVTSRPVQSGQIIASGISNVGGGTTLMTLSDLSRIFVNANVDESDVGKVKVGQRSMITADAYPGKRFRGEVVRVASKGVTNSNVVTFEVKIEVQGEGHDLLKPEMTANVDIQADRREAVLMLPNEAVQYGRGGYFVEVPKDGGTTTTRTQIKTGLTDGLNTEIVEGIKEGDEIAMPSSMQSRWAKGPGDQAGGQQGGQNFNRGLQRAAWSMSGSGGTGGARGSGGSGGGGGGRGGR
jgi:HlyD family secretion protein